MDHAYHSALRSLPELANPPLQGCILRGAGVIALLGSPAFTMHLNVPGNLGKRQGLIQWVEYGAYDSTSNQLPGDASAPFH